jgi:hypothetical protein
MGVLYNLLCNGVARLTPRKPSEVRILGSTPLIRDGEELQEDRSQISSQKIEGFVREMKTGVILLCATNRYNLLPP